MARNMTWTLVGKAAHLALDWSKFDHKPIDPYLIWADLTGFHGASLSQAPVVAQQARLQVALELDCQGGKPRIGVPYLEVVQSADVCWATASVTAEQLPALLDQAAVRRLEIGFVEASAPAAARQAEKPQRIDGPVVAVIDFGCAFAHERFRHWDGNLWRTRIEYLWDQADRPPDGPWRAVHRQRQGRELTRSDIEGLLATHQVRGRVHEDAVYGAARYTDVSARLTHGTHVLDLAAGAEPAASIDGEPKIIFVQLPARAVEDTSGGSMVTCVLDALRYILDRTHRAHPLLINLSYGSMAGPHDGSTLLETAMDAVVANTHAADKPGGRSRFLEIVLPAGNNFESDGHARLRLDSRARKQTLLWQVLPDDPTDTFLEVWYRPEGAASLNVAVTTPSGQHCEVSLNESKVLAAVGSARPVAAVIHRQQVASGRDAAMVLVALAPTTTRDRAVPTAEAGIWQVTVSLALSAPASTAVEVFAWIERDDPAIGSRSSPRQSRFVTDQLPLARNQGSPIDSLVQRAGTCNSIANGGRTIVVGGCIGRGAEIEPARYSSSGPTRRMQRTWPDLVTTADDSLALPGVLAAGTRSGVKARMNGTSVAAPQVARAMIQKFFVPVGVLGAKPAASSTKPGNPKPPPRWTTAPSSTLFLDPAAHDDDSHRRRVGRGRLQR